MSSSLREEFRLSSITLNYPELSCFHRPQWTLPSWAYLLWRLFWCVWHVGWLIASGVRTANTAPQGEDASKWFVYASNWTFLVTTVFCLVDLAVVICALCWTRRDERTDESQPEVMCSSNQPEEILFQGEFTLVDGIKTESTPTTTKIQWCLFEVVNCTNALTTIMFWASQYKDGDYIHADVVVFNIVNTIFVMANTMLTGNPVRILHFIYPAAFIALYFLFNLIYFLADGTSLSGSDVTFKPLDWNEAYPTALTLVVGFLVAIPLTHVIFFSLFTLRIYLCSGNNEVTQTLPKVEGQSKKGGSGNGIEERGEGQGYRSAQDNPGFEMELESQR